MSLRPLSFIPLSAVVGRRVRSATGADLGRLVDVIARSHGDTYPPLSGLIVRVRRRPVRVPIDAVAQLEPDGVTVSAVSMRFGDVVRGPGETLLVEDLVDHQVVDADGARVVRVADLYLSDLASGARLVGIDVSLQALVRRLAPLRRRGPVRRERVIDWAALQPIDAPGGPLRLRRRDDADRPRQSHRIDT